jgi:hypothetical protein
MPNWCWNSVCIVGNSSDLDRIKSKIEEADSFLNGLYPQDQDWNYDHWMNVYGVKWSDQMEGRKVNREDKNCISFGVETPWGPPSTGMQTISTFWPSCTFGIAYSEPGMDFVGLEVYNNGVLEAEDGGDYPDLGDWENDPDGCTERQTEFELENVDSMVKEVKRHASLVQKVRLLKSDS